MACSTECDQVVDVIFPGVATESFVVNLEVAHCAARLASPSISLERLLPKLLILLRRQPQWETSWRK
jgi:hypothetical protein